MPHPLNPQTAIETEPGPMISSPDHRMIAAPALLTKLFVRLRSLVMEKWHAFGRIIYFFRVFVLYILVLSLFFAASLTRLEEIKTSGYQDIPSNLTGVSAFQNPSGLWRLSLPEPLRFVGLGFQPHRRLSLPEPLRFVLGHAQLIHKYSHVHIYMHCIFACISARVPQCMHT